LARTARFQETFRRLTPYLRRYRRTAVLIVILGAFAAVGQRLTLVFLKPLVSLLFPVAGNDPAELSELSILDRFSEQWLKPAFESFQLFDWSSEMSTVVMLIVIMVGCAVVFSVMQYFFLRASRMIGIWMIVDLRQDLAEHMLRLGMRYHSGRRLGDIISRMTADVSTSLRLLNILVEELIQGPFNILASLFLAYAAAPRATLAMLIFIPLLAVPIMKIGPRVRRRSAKSQEKLGDTTHTLMQMLSGIRVVKAFRLEQREALEFRAANDEFVKQTDRMVRAQATSQGFTAFLAQAGTGLLIGALVIAQLSSYRFFSDAGSMTVFFLGIGTMFAHIKRLTKALSNIYVSMGATQRIFEVFDLPVDQTDDQIGETFVGLKQEIRFEQVGFDYGSGEGPALQGITFTVKRGERIALVGASGAGKSTLLDLIARFYQPTCGKILVDGHDLAELKRADWLDRLAVVSQRPFLFQTTLGENVQLGKPGANKEEILQALQAAHLGDFLSGLQEGLETQVGEQGTRLSGGQAQRVTIARAILRDADILLLDEATSALDTEAERKVQEALHTLLENRTAFVIAHRLSTIQTCDRILVMKDGQLVEEGSHEQLLADGGDYAKMWALQSQA
jgi:ATP-binding cassette, subfamily B, bacterial MsbA